MRTYSRCIICNNKSINVPLRLEVPVIDAKHFQTSPHVCAVLEIHIALQYNYTRVSRIAQDRHAHQENVFSIQIPATDEDDRVGDSKEPHETTSRVQNSSVHKLQQASVTLVHFNHILKVIGTNRPASGVLGVAEINFISQRSEGHIGDNTQNRLPEQSTQARVPT